MRVQLVHYSKFISFKSLIKKFGERATLREPLVFQLAKKQWMTLLKFGVIAWWNVPQKRQEVWLKRLRPFFIEAFEVPIHEEMTIDPRSTHEQVTPEGFSLTGISKEKVGLVSLVLGRSLALEFYEKEMDRAFSDLVPIMKSLEQRGKLTISTRTMMKKVGFAMNMQHIIVAQMTLLDKPDITWEDPGLDRFYEELSEEYELEYRYTVLDEKLKLVMQSIEFLLNALETRRGLFLEWGILLLVLIEVLLFVYELSG